jgi:hypothetical protein
MRQHGEFILLMEGTAVCYCADFETIKSRLNELYAKNPASTFIITQVVGTVDKPTVPVIHCVYNAKNI